jgi:hypothetical protein
MISVLGRPKPRVSCERFIFVFWGSNVAMISFCSCVKETAPFLQYLCTKCGQSASRFDGRVTFHLLT